MASAASAAAAAETRWSKEVDVAASPSFPTGKIVVKELPRRPGGFFDHMLSVEGVLLDVTGRVIFLDVVTVQDKVHTVDPVTGNSSEQLRADFTVELFGLLQEEAAKALAAPKPMPTRIAAANFAGGRIGDFDHETLAARPEFVESQRECRAAAELAHAKIFKLMYDEGFFSPEDPQMKTAWESARRPVWEKTSHARDADRDVWEALPAHRGLNGSKADAAFEKWACETQPLLEDEAATVAFEEWSSATPPSEAECASARGYFFRQAVKTLFYDGEMAPDRVTVKTPSELRSRFKAGVPIWRKNFEKDGRTPTLTLDGKPTFRHDPVPIFSEVGRLGEQLESPVLMPYEPMQPFPIRKADVVRFYMKPRVFHQPGGKWSLAFDIVRNRSIVIGRRGSGISTESDEIMTPPLFFGRPPNKRALNDEGAAAREAEEESTRNKFARKDDIPNLV